MASKRTDDAGGICCWLRVRLRKGEDELYFCRECGPEALRERIGGPGPNIGMYPNDTPADAVCGRCGYGLRGGVPVLEAEPVGRGKGRRWRVWCVYCERYHHHEPQPWFRGRLPRIYGDQPAGGACLWWWPGAADPQEAGWVKEPGWVELDEGAPKVPCRDSPTPSPYRETGYFLRLKVARNGR